jgi:hypothetical protein
MKKVVSVLLVFAVLLALSSCALIGKVYDKEAAEFSSNGLKITLTEAFSETTVENYTVCFASKSVLVLGLKEAFSIQEGLADLTLNEYAALVRQSNSEKSPTEISKENGLTSFEYSFLNTEENKTYRYFTVMYKGSDAFWTVQLACEESAYEEYKPYMIEWAKSVTV